MRKYYIEPYTIKTLFGEEIEFGDYFEADSIQELYEDVKESYKMSASVDIFQEDGIKYIGISCSRHEIKTKEVK